MVNVEKLSAKLLPTFFQTGQPRRRGSRGNSEQQGGGRRGGFRQGDSRLRRELTFVLGIR